MSKKERNPVSVRVEGNLATLRIGSVRIAEAVVRDGKAPDWMVRAANILRSESITDLTEARRITHSLRSGPS